MPKIFDRLVGLETEYGIRFHTTESDWQLKPTKFQLYRALIGALRLRIPLVRAKHFKEGVFTANGGAVWFETERLTSRGGLIEGSTPECRGARQMLIYQRAQDRMLSEAAAAAVVPGEFTLVKNCRDARDNVYGAQENFEVPIADNWRLIAWRIGLILLIPLAILTWISLVLMVAAVFVYLAVAGLIYLPLRLFTSRRQQLATLLFGRDLATGEETGAPLPAWLESLMLWAARVTSAPLAVPLILLARWTLFVSVRRKLTPFLVTRAVITGAGLVDKHGKFQLADKAPAINCVLGFGGYLWDRPIYNFGHFFKAVSIESLLAPSDYFRMFKTRQRLQIGLGDSNRNESAEYLRIGTMLLVLDAIELGYLKTMPAIKSPIRSLHRLVADSNLQTTVRLSDGNEHSPIAVQRMYFEACQRMLDDRLDAPEDAFEVLRLWGRVLDGLEGDRSTLIGCLDWATKQFVLNETGKDVGWDVKKKLDIRYHEISPEGYFEQLATTGLVQRITTDEEIERAMRSAPPGSPATTRGHYIREFAESDEPLSANWKRLVIGRGRRAKVIRLDQYQQTHDTTVDS